jgi:hypothetical protein
MNYSRLEALSVDGQCTAGRLRWPSTAPASTWATPTSPGRQDRFLSDDAYRRLAAIRARRDPSGRLASYLTSDPAGLNVRNPPN